MILVHNENLLEFIRPFYSPAQIEALHEFLARRGTFDAPRLPNGLYPAAGITDRTRYTGYGHVWVRDNVHIANTRLMTGQADAARRTVEALARFFRSQRGRFDAIIRGDADPSDPHNRPWIRFDGLRWREAAPPWSHAQNDALGYFLWIYCRLANLRVIPRSRIDWETLWRFVRYFEAIAFWRDEDSGHWEEQRKISASSIGTVLAGLRELGRLLERTLGEPPQIAGRISTLLAQGTRVLDKLLPWECRQRDPGRRRRHDAALLFLLWPLDGLDPAMRRRILEEVLEHLSGELGIRRYNGDSFWCSDYKEKLPPHRRTTDLSLSIENRNALLRPGEEAEWCLFDPLVSLISGDEYRRTGRSSWRNRQFHHLNRSLGHLTGPGLGFPEFRCPELYYRERGKWKPNDATPLLWTQALLEAALTSARISARQKPLR